MEFYFGFQSTSGSSVVFRHFVLQNKMPNRIHSDSIATEVALRALIALCDITSFLQAHKFLLESPFFTAGVLDLAVTALRSKIGPYWTYLCSGNGKLL